MFIVHIQLNMASTGLVVSNQVARSGPCIMGEFTQPWKNIFGNPLLVLVYYHYRRRFIMWVFYLVYGSDISANRRDNSELSLILCFYTGTADRLTLPNLIVEFVHFVITELSKTFNLYFSYLFFKFFFAENHGTSPLQIITWPGLVRS